MASTMSKDAEGKPVAPRSKRMIIFLRICSLLVGCVSAGMAVSMNAVTAYANAFKDTFHCTQTELETVIAMAYVGQISSLPAGMLLKCIGPKWSSAIALVLSAIGSLMTYVSFYYVHFFRSNFMIFILFFLAQGMAGGFMYITSSSVNMSNFADKRLGLISGLLHSSRSAVTILLIFLWEKCFYDGGKGRNIDGHGLPGYFLLMSCAYIVTCLLGILVYGDYPPDEEDDVKKTKEEEEDTFEQELQELVAKDKPKKEPETLLELLKTYRFHFLVWPLVILLGYRTSFGNNVTTYLKSFNFESYETVVVFILPLVGLLTKPTIGCCSDLLIHKVPRSAFLLFWSITVCVCSAFSLLFFNTLWMQILASIIVSLGASYGQSLGPAIMVNFFGRKIFAIGWGVVTVGWAMWILIFNELVGLFYDMAIPEGEIYCYGIKCYLFSFLSGTILCLVAAIMFGFIFRIEYKKHKGI